MKKFIKNRIADLLKERTTKGFAFVPTRDFYNEIGVRQKRWTMLLRNDIPIDSAELYAIAKYFNVEYTVLLK